MARRLRPHPAKPRPVGRRDASAAHPVAAARSRACRTTRARPTACATTRRIWVTLSASARRVRSSPERGHAIARGVLATREDSNPRYLAQGPRAFRVSYDEKRSPRSVEELRGRALPRRLEAGRAPSRNPRVRLRRRGQRMRPTVVRCAGRLLSCGEGARALVLDRAPASVAWPSARGDEFNSVSSLALPWPWPRLPAPTRWPRSRAAGWRAARALHG